MAEYDQQVTCKVTRSTKEQLDQLGQAAGVSTGQFVRNLIEAGLRGDAQREELRELRDAIAKLAAQVSEGQKAPPVRATLDIPEDFLNLPEQLSGVLDSVSKSIEEFHGQVADLRGDLARMLAMLHQYRTGSRDPAASVEFARQLTDR